MGRKLLVPVSAIVLAALAGVAIWFLMADPKPRAIETNDIADNSPLDDSERRPRPLNPRDFDAGTLKPDPVQVDRPAQPFDAPRLAQRIIISGRVVTDAGLPVADAQVTFFGEQKLRDVRGHGYSDNTGAYQLIAWAAKPADTMAAEGWGRVAALTIGDEVGLGERVQITDTASVNMPDIVIKPSVVIEGLAQTADGTPAPGAEITATSAGPVEVTSLRGRTPSVATRQYVTTVVADAGGRFSLRGLPPAEYRLTASGHYFGLLETPITADVRNTAYLWQDVRLTGVNFVRGTLTDEGGAPIAGAVVQLRLAKPDASAGLPTERPNIRTVEAQPRIKPEVSDRTARRFPDVGNQPRGLMRVATDHAGRFGFNGVIAGEYVLAAKLGDAEASVEGVKPNEGEHNLRIGINSLVAGVVRDAETGQPVEAFDVRLLPGAGETGVNPFERVAETGRFEYRPGGNYAFVNPAPGALRVRVSAPGYAPTVVDIGTLAAAETKRDADVRLQPLCEAVFRLSRDGRALDLEPVALLFDDRLAYAACSNELAVVRITGVTPAEYTVRVVLADGTQLEGRLTVPAKRHATLELVLK